MRERRLPEVAGTRNVNPKPRWTHYRSSYFFLARQYLGPLCQCPCLGAGRGMMGARPGFNHVRLLDVMKQVHHLK
jgi:hypothetical protein